MLVDQLWYKNAIIYCCDVETFMDANGDGIGDFEGLKRRLSYLEGIGVTCIWLLPFYPTPNHDNGYDITDYYGIDPRLGDLGDFVEFSHEARRRGLRLMVDLVLNHTSVDHPWFQAARRDPASKYRDYYVWSQEKPHDMHEGMVFPGHQETTWTYDDVAGAYYMHRFFPFQPDLNVGNPAVRREMLKVIGAWLELGVSGFRVDAVPFLIEPRGLRGFTREQGFRFLNEIRDFISFRNGEAVLLAEANVTMEEVKDYFDDGRRMQLVLNFQANQRLFLALVDEDATQLAQSLAAAPPLGKMAQWAHFLRNHDELDLGRLTEEERQRAFAALGPHPDMQLYNRGLRRRLAGLLGGDEARLHFCYALLMGLPGTPVLWYGEELGMVENLALPDRQAVRTPMQWSSDRNAGFSSAATTIKPVLAEGARGSDRVNVAASRRDPTSLLNCIERLIRLRKESPEIGFGDCQVLQVADTRVLALRYDWRGQTLVTAYNFGRHACSLDLVLSDITTPLTDAFSGEQVQFQGSYAITLRGSGFCWLRAGAQDAVASAAVAAR